MSIFERILVTGANSYVGARVFSELSEALPGQVSGTYHRSQLLPEFLKMDLAQPPSVHELVQSMQPSWIVQIAAIPNQAGCAKDENYAEKVNLEGVKALVAAANAVGSRIIFVSSEAAYDQTLYGRLKKQAEEAIKETAAGWVILQPAMIFGLSPNTTNDRPYNRLLRAIEKKAPVSVDSALKFYPTWLGHMSEVVRLVIERNILNETIAVVGERLSSRFEIAQRLLPGFQIEVKEEGGKDTGSNAPLTQDALRRLQLPVYTSDQIINYIIDETKSHFAGATAR